MSSNDIAIRVCNLGKCYHLYAKPQDRLKQFIKRGHQQYFREFWALHDVSFEVKRGEVLGVIGRNGSGKSTLLQLICGTLTPTHGEVETTGRVAALLELGAGFNPEFSGRENVFMNAAIMGLSPQEIEKRFDEIVDFSGIAEFIDQPVKTYSSGMYVRLAFAVATSIDPDILVIDEALSVGDGEFARKSFDRIMALKDAGKTILFCSHSLYQVEAICDRVIWLNNGALQVNGEPAEAIVAYNRYLDMQRTEESASFTNSPSGNFITGRASIARITVSVDGIEGAELHVSSGESTVIISLEYHSDPTLPSPTVAVLFQDASGRPVASAGTGNDGFVINRTAEGEGKATVIFEKFPLLKGSYWVYAFLMCEKAIHFYEYANMVAQLHVEQKGLEVGIVALEHRWKTE